MESSGELNENSRGTATPESIEFREKRQLNRNASLGSACSPRKTHVRTGSDFWTQVAEQTTFIDSTRSSLLVDQSQLPPRSTQRVGGSSSTPSLHHSSGKPLQHRYNSVREAKRYAKLARFYSNEQNNVFQGGELRVLQPLLPAGTGSRTSLAAIWAAVDPKNQSGIYPRKPVTRKPSSWEESVSLERRRSLAARGITKPHLHLPTGSFSPGINLPISGLDTKDLRYCFQHPYIRLFSTMLVIFCNFLLFAEDPISHSHTESVIPMVGNVFSFVCTKYPPDLRWALIKVLMWIFAIICGLIMGKIFIHGMLFGKYLRLKMFRDEQGSWIAMFLTVILSLYLFSHVYNQILKWFYNRPNYLIDNAMGISNSAVMKGAACGTWLGDLVTWLMVIDVMLQDSLYPDWAPLLRRIWRASNIPRILMFWVGSAFCTALVVTLIVSDLISWDTLNRDFVASTELSRAFLASFILVLDLVIMMQDWDFPHFTTTVHINLPGFSVAKLEWKYAEVNLTGKWFSYGVIVMVMMLDLNMWKNQIFYEPSNFGQYVGPDHKIHTVSDQAVLQTGNTSLWTWESRSKINETTRLPYYLGDMKMNTQYMGYPLLLKCTAFLPSIITLSIFLWLIYLYGRFPHKKEEVVSKAREKQSKSDKGITV